LVLFAPGCAGVLPSLLVCVGPRRRLGVRFEEH
jgi:hypothetical protein